VVGGYGSAALRDYGRAGHILIIADLLNGIDHIIGILPQAVVGAGGGGSVGAVVVHREAPAHIEILDLAHLASLGIDPGCLVHGILDSADIGDLGADVKVNHLQALLKAPLPQNSHQLQGFASGQAELGRLAARLHPPARAAGEELYPHA